MSNLKETLQNGQITHDVSSARKINNLLNSSKTRIEGLELLRLFLPQCSDDEFCQFCINWMQNCCKIDALTRSRNLAINLLNDLLKVSSNYQELKKSVSFFITTRYFDFFFKFFLNSQSGWSCTETCLLLYRGACGPFHDNLEKYLRNEFKKNMKISSIICKCFALMPSIGGGGNEGINYKENWKSQFIEFLNVCHFLLNELFGDFGESQECEILEYSYKANERNVQYLVTQLNNYSKVLIRMLLNQYPASKSVPSDLILQLICRGLALNLKNITTQETVDIISLQKILPDVHHILLSLFKALIVACKNQLFPYSHLVCKLIKQSFEWTKSDFINGSENSFARLRISIYEALCNWLAVTGNGSCVEATSNVVISNAVSDIRSKNDMILLKDVILQSQSKRKEQITRRFDVTTNKLCLAALKALQFLLKFVGVSLKPEEHKFLQEVTVKLLVEVQRSSALDVVVPFGVTACRMELYALLLELVHHPCPKWPPPTNLALRLFGRGINDSSPEVSLLCSAALNFTTIIIHSQYDNGEFLLREISDNRNWVEVELQESEPVKPEIEKGSEISPSGIPKNSKNLLESSKNDPSKKFSDFNGESSISSDEDSRNTVTFSKDVELNKKNFGIIGTKAEQGIQQLNLSISEPSQKKRRTSKEEPSLEKIHSSVKVKPFESHPPIIKETYESDEMKKLAEISPSDLNSVKSISSETINEDGQPKTRYFLRSKTKGSSEEPEEASKRSNISESLQSTPAKTLAKSTSHLKSVKKRPSIKTTMRVETSSEKGGKMSEKSNRVNEDEDIKATFDDSFID